MIDDYFRKCVVRIQAARNIGTGFFVSYGKLMTCKHVIEFADAHDKPIFVYWGSEKFQSKVIHSTQSEYPDLALLEVPLLEHPFVEFNGDISIGDKLYSFGFPEEYPQGDSLTIEYEGPTGERPLYLKLKEGQISPGFSGAPLLNLKTAHVCGIVKKTRGRNTDLGGRAIPFSVIKNKFNNLFLPTSENSLNKTKWNKYTESFLNPDITEGDLSCKEDFVNIQVLSSKPKLFANHRYSLVETNDVFGRADEETFLNDWAFNSTEANRNYKLLCITAIGGMGKSALAWKWINQCSTSPEIEYQGFFWWSFYEEGASYENFIRAALTYVAGNKLINKENISLHEQETLLLQLISSEKYVFVLDGFERLLLAYARMDASRMDEKSIDNDTENYLIIAEKAKQEVGSNQQNKRKTINPRIGLFLKKLLKVDFTKTLITSRLIPADIQGVTGQILPGALLFSLKGLDSISAVKLWENMGITGPKEDIRRFFEKISYYPLLIRLLGGEIASFRRSPGNFSEWKTANPSFDPYRISLINVHSHVLLYSLKGLLKIEREVLKIISCFRWPISYSIIEQLFLGTSGYCKSEQELDEVLTKLEDRGLIGWDRSFNKYDMHPIIRGVIWQSLDKKKRFHIYEQLNSVFGNLADTSGFLSFPEEDWDSVETIDELAIKIELFFILVNLERFKSAYQLFEGELHQPLRWKFGAFRLIIRA